VLFTGELTSPVLTHLSVPKQYLGGLLRLHCILKYTVLFHNSAIDETYNGHHPHNAVPCWSCRHHSMHVSLRHSTPCNDKTTSNCEDCYNGRHANVHNRIRHLRRGAQHPWLLQSKMVELQASLHIWHGTARVVWWEPGTVGMVPTVHVAAA
jgi:hypothetical protein